MKGSEEVIATVTESVHFLKVQHERFYPCPHSCQCRALWSTWSSNSPAPPPVCSKDYPSTGWEHPCPLGAAPGAAGQGSQFSCSYQSTTSSLMPSTSGNTFQTEPMRQTSLCLGKMGSSLARLTCYLTPPCPNPSTCRSREYHSYLAGEPYSSAPAAANDVELSRRNFCCVSFDGLSVSMIQIPSPSTTHGRGSSTSAFCWAPALPGDTTSALPGGATQDNTEKNLKSLDNQGFAYQTP